jgi:YHS domain-containing protein
MIRFLILLGIGYFGYKLIKSWILQHTSLNKTVAGKSVGQIDDIMVKDPYCEVYFPKREGVHLKVDGEDLYFCSKACRDKFVAARSEKNN